jgi:hypothetical protein
MKRRGARSARVPRRSAFNDMAITKAFQATSAAMDEPIA